MGLSLLADCLYRGRGEMQNKTEARRMWRTAADHGEVLAMLSLGEDCAARGEAGKALLYYRKARQTAQGMPDIEYTPRICLRLAQAETRYVSAKKAMALAAEAAQGFAILAGCGRIAGRSGTAAAGTGRSEAPEYGLQHRFFTIGLKNGHRHRVR